MKVLHAASEVYPLVSTGGLSSVSAALPGALNRLSGVEAAVVMPLYSSVREKCTDIKWHGSGRTFLEEEFGVGSVVRNGLTVFLIAKNEFFNRDGIYGPSPDTPWEDNAARYSFFSRAVCSVGSVTGFMPDVLHCHDWQTGLIPVYCAHGDVATVFTIHNLKFQGRFGRDSYHVAGLPETLYTMDALEFWSDWNCMKGGILFSDMVTTVSPEYAKEILTPEYGFSLDGVLRSISGRLRGILNGIDTVSRDPAQDKSLPATYSPGDMKGRVKCRRVLMKKSGLNSTGPVLGMVSRLTPQKGIDLVLDSLEWMVEKGMSLVVLGTGEKWAEKGLLEASENYSGRISAIIDYDDRLARLIFAGSDGFLMPSAFEPCGLGQMMAMRYGSVPLVRKVGGLANTVTDQTGFTFTGGADKFREALLRLRKAWINKRSWAWLRRRCMEKDFSWNSRTASYLQVYREALKWRSN